MQPTVSIPVILFALTLSTSAVYAAPLPVQTGQPSLIIKVQDEDKVIEQEQNKDASPAEASEPAAPAESAPAGSSSDDETKVIEKEQDK